MCAFALIMIVDAMALRTLEHVNIETLVDFLLGFINKVMLVRKFKKKEHRQVDTKKDYRVF